MQFQLDLGDFVERRPAAAPAATPEAIFARVFRVLRPRTPLPEIQIRWRPYANVHSSVRLESGQLWFKISDLLQASPESVIEALGYILIGKLYRKRIPKAYLHRYNVFLNRRDVRRDLDRLRQTRGRKFISGSRGEVHDLAPIFEDLNRRYFDGMMACPQLGWSRTASKQLLGHFDAGHNAIIISRIFDCKDVPRIALEFVMYHEMLHLRYPTQYRGARRCIHSAEFKKSEREFAAWKEAGELLKRL
ncbi:MAG TPA: M48 family peptidase [Bryobacteraceae bacterium]